MDIYQHSRLYNTYYYSHGYGHSLGRNDEWLTFFKTIAERIATLIHPNTVMDAGCAMGLLVKFLRQYNIQAFGMDISEYALHHIDEEARPFCWIGSVSEPFPQKFDIIVCIEVLEHLPRYEAEEAIKNFCQYSDDILFSSTPFDYKEATHFNVQTPDYWAETYARYGFFRDVEFDASFITPWAVRFRRQTDPLENLVRKYERKFFLLWKENLDLRNQVIGIRQELASAEQALHDLNIQMAEREGMLSGNLRNLTLSSLKSKLSKVVRRLLQNLK